MITSLFSVRSLLYLCYALLLTALILYVRFPTEKFKAYCERHVEHLLPGSTCDIEGIRYRFPMSADFGGIKVTRIIEGKVSEMTVDRLLMTPELLQFWRTFSLRGEMYTGTFQAALDVDRGKRTFHLADINLEEVAVSELAAGIGLVEDKISGRFLFSGDYQASISQPIEGTGQGVIQVRAGSMKFLQPILGLSTLDFERVSANVIRESKQIRFAEGEVVGREMTADFSGTLQLNSPITNSSVLLSGQLHPDAGYLKNNPKQEQLVQRLLRRYKVKVLPFKVGGTVKRPLFRFSK